MLLACVMFVVAVLILLITSTVFDSSLGQLSLTAQRWIGRATLVLPSVIGAILALLGLTQG
ncbi:MAG TPA: hypothetical protein VFZ66_17920 [Herpetosiphonaceae bacterium]